MKVIKFIKTTLTTDLDSTKSVVEIFAIIFAGIFAVIQWGVPTYWDRQENYLLSFKSNDENSGVFINETLSDGQCTLQGTVTFSNYSNSPIDIINTKVSLVTFETDKSCNDSSNNKCFVSYSGADVFERLCPNKECDTPYKVTIPPIIWEQPLYGKTDATRPFSVSIPQRIFQKNNALLVVADQEIGRGCIDEENPNRRILDNLSSCKYTRALVVDTNACQKKIEVQES
jgi:hypothetical protein